MDDTAEEFVRRLVNEESYAELGDEGSSEDVPFRLPPWYDEEKFKKGQRFYQDNLYSSMLCDVLGIITIISVPTILQVLVNTKKSSSPYTAYRRYVSTILHVHSWQTCDLKPGSTSWKSLLTTRQRHFKASKGASAKGVGRISQRDIGLTQFGLMGHVLLFPDQLGVVAYETDSWEGYIHTWATFGYMLGLKDKYNICLGSFERAVDICRILMERVYQPLLEFPVEPYEHMACSLLAGVWAMMPLLGPKVFLYLVRMYAGVPGYVYWQQDLVDFRRRLKSGELPKTVEPALKSWNKTHSRPDYKPRDFYRLADVPEYKHLTFFERINLHVIVFLGIINSTYIGKCCLNFIGSSALWLAQNFPILAYLRGYRNVMVNIFKEDIGDDTAPMSNAEVRKMLNRPPWYANMFGSKRA